jgi:aspartyl protease family protein
MAMVTETGALSLQRANDGHFYADIEVNGRTVRFLIDTGATSVALSPGDARRVGLDPDALDYTRTVSTANGRVMVAPVRLGRMQLGPILLEDVPAHVNPGMTAGSLLGMSFLGRLSRVAIEGDTLVLDK